MKDGGQAVDDPPPATCRGSLKPAGLFMLSVGFGLVGTVLPTTAEADSLSAVVEEGAGAGNTRAQSAKEGHGATLVLSETSQRVDLGGFTLYADCRGSGEVTILFEAGLGGSALEWQAIQNALAPRARSCVYDRAGYGRSDPSPQSRDALHLAVEADQLLDALGVMGPLILVGHSFGGFVVRLLAMQRDADMLAMVLVDASHEDQLQRLEKANGRKMMPSGSNFFISPPSIPDSLPAAIRQRIQLHARQRKTYAALHAEMASFRRSAQQVSAARTLVDYPVFVVRRGLDLYAGEVRGARKTAIWNELQQDLATISHRGKLIVAESSGHHVHADQPQLLIDVLTELLDDFAHAASADAARRRLP